MPELPEVEVLVRHLRPLLEDKSIKDVFVLRARVIRPASARDFQQKLRGGTFLDLTRRGKYLLFTLRGKKSRKPVVLFGHLGMTGRMYLTPANAALPKHAAVIFKLSRGQQFVFEDTRGFGRLTFEMEAVQRLGPEPLHAQFTVETLAGSLGRSTQPIKIKLMDQSILAGLGNIYASEALFRAGISPLIPARKLSTRQLEALHAAIRDVLVEAIQSGSTVPLNFSGTGNRDGLFYFGRAPGSSNSLQERLRVYDRAGLPCLNCGQKVVRLFQAGRSTYYCPHCQK